MINIIKMLYDGKIDPSGYVGLYNYDLQNMIKKNNDECKSLRKNMSEEDAKRLIKFDDLNVELTLKYSYEYFSYGFKLAVRLMCEAFMDDLVLEDKDQLSPSVSFMKAANKEFFCGSKSEVAEERIK